MLRFNVGLGVLVIVAYTAEANAAPDPDDVQPTSHDTPLPDPDLAYALPLAGVPPAPPTDAWWSARGACRKGTRLVNRDVRVDAPKGTMEIHECVGKGAWPRPKTGISHWKDRQIQGHYWVNADDKTHGGFRELMGERSEHVGYILHGVEDRAQIDRIVGERGEHRETYRDGRLHGLYVSELNSMPSAGYYAKGRRTGTWLVWRSLDGAVKGRLRYRDGALDGAQRWWFADGKVLGRGTFTAGKGTWEILGRDGKRRSTTSCDGRKLVEGQVVPSGIERPRVAWNLLRVGKHVQAEADAKGRQNDCRAGAGSATLGNPFSNRDGSPDAGDQTPGPGGHRCDRWRTSCCVARDLHVAAQDSWNRFASRILRIAISDGRIAPPCDYDEMRQAMHEAAPD